MSQTYTLFSQMARSRDIYQTRLERLSIVLLPIMQAYAGPFGKFNIDFVERFNTNYEIRYSWNTGGRDETDVMYIPHVIVEAEDPVKAATENRMLRERLALMKNRDSIKQQMVQLQQQLNQIAEVN